MNGFTWIKKKDKKSNRTNDTVFSGEKDIVTVDDDAVSEKNIKWILNFDKMRNGNLLVQLQ